MKKTLLLLSFLSFFSVLQAQPLLVFEQTTRNMGTILWEQPKTAVFKLTNKSSNPLRITNVRTDCGCTSVSFPKEEIEPGGTGEICVSYNAELLGHFSKSVAVYVEGVKDPVYLRIMGNVSQTIVENSDQFPFQIGDYYLNTDDIEFDDVNRGDRPQKKIHIFNSTSAAVQPVVMHLPEYLKADVSPSNIAPGHGGVITMTLDSRKLDDMGLTQTSVFLGAFPGDKVNREKEIGISAVLLPKFDNLTAQQLANAPQLYLSTTELNLGRFDQKKKLKGEIVIRNDGKSVLKIKSLQMFTVGLQVSLNKQTLHPGESAKLKVTAEKRQLKTARSKPRVLMITNDPKQPKTTIKIVAE